MAQHITQRPSARRLGPAPAAALLLPTLALAGLAAGCSSGGGDDSDTFVIRSTTHGTAAVTPPVVSGKWLIYFADEATSGPLSTAIDLNGDADVIDAVAILVDMGQASTAILGVAIPAPVAPGSTEWLAATIGNEVYVVADENRDDTDWDGDLAKDDLVLLHWSTTQGLPMVYVDTIDPAAAARPMRAIDGRLYYCSATAPVGVDDTTLMRIGTAAPVAPVPVLTDGAGQLHPRFLGEDDLMVFLLLDEAVDGNLNGDLDSTDGNVLALLNGDLDTAAIQSVGLALPSDDTPFAAADTGTNDWVAAFLVSEAGQGANLNDPVDFALSWNPVQCVTPDIDMTDDVLHWLAFATWTTAATNPVNTGLVGADRVLAFTDVATSRDFVATLSPEADAFCDLNVDTDSLDMITRWVEALDPPVPPGLQAQMIAVVDLPGGSHGLTDVEGHLVAIAGEAENDADYDGKVADHDLAALLRPAAGNPSWDFSHLGSSVFIGTGITGEPYAGASWMASEPQSDRLGIAFQETVPDLSLNNSVGCAFVAKDADKTDSLPVWADIEGGPVLDFDGLGYALTTNNPGIVVSKGWIFFRVSEANDNKFYNEGGAGDMTDDILFRNPATTCSPTAMATASAVVGPVVVTDNVTGAAFFCSEPQASEDLNGDGDMGDLVIRYFTF